MSDRDRDRRYRSSTDPNDVQYRSSRGTITTRVAHSQAERTGDPRTPGRSSYPSEYRNSEGRAPNTRTNFDDYERRANERLVEIPVRRPGESSFDPSRRSATARQVERSEPHNLARNDRRRVAAQPPNDPGPHRVVVAARESDGRSRPLGVMSHPEDNPRGYTRARMTPRDHEGRQQDRMHSSLNSGGSSSFPPQGMDSDELTRREREYRQDRPRRREGERRRRRDD